MAKELTFEERIKRLEEIQEKMESGELSLEENTKYFDEAQLHNEFCKDLLSKAELKVTKVVGDKEVEFSSD